jgi:hypothetical protein
LFETLKMGIERERERERIVGCVLGQAFGSRLGDAYRMSSLREVIDRANRASFSLIRPPDNWAE